LQLESLIHSKCDGPYSLKIDKISLVDMLSVPYT